MKRVILFAIAAMFVTIVQAQTFVLTKVDVTDYGYKMFEKNRGWSKERVFKETSEDLGKKWSIEIYDEVLKLRIPDDNAKGYEEIPLRKTKENTYALVWERGKVKMEVILNTFFGYIRSFEYRVYQDGKQIYTVFCKRE